MTTLRALTSHPIVIYAPDTPDQIDPDDHTPILVIDGAEQPARLDKTEIGRQAPLNVDGADIPIATVAVGGPAGDWPEPCDGVLYVVSMPTATAAQRDDFLVIHREVRNHADSTIGCRALARITH